MMSFPRTIVFAKKNKISNIKNIVKWGSQNKYEKKHINPFFMMCCNINFSILKLKYFLIKF